MSEFNKYEDENKEAKNFNLNNDEAASDNNETNADNDGIIENIEEAIPETADGETETLQKITAFPDNDAEESFTDKNACPYAEGLCAEGKEQAPCEHDTSSDTINNAAEQPRTVGESAGIRYNADNSKNAGAYTWQYCQGSNTAPINKAPVKKHTGLKVFALIAASVFVVGALTVGSLIFIDKCSQNGDNAGFNFSHRFPSYDDENKNNLPVIGQNKDSAAASYEESAFDTVVFDEQNDSDALSKQAIAVKCKPSSVGIEVAATIPSYFGYSYKSSGVGSGFILTEDGYIATNNHVIEGADEIAVMLDDGTRYNATVIGADSITDLAVIKIDATGLIPMEIGNSDIMRVGDSVIAIGTPAGIEFAGTVTDGIISAINRDVEVNSYNGYTKTMTLMQTNAAINPGNSGGPLVNSKGQVIGINTLKLNEKYEGIGFSIPINSAVKIFNQLIADGKVTDYDIGFVTGKGSIGITNYDEVDREKAEYYGLPEGIMVIQMKPGCSAQKAGLRRGDIIIAFNGSKVTTAEQLNKLKDEFNAGDEVTLTVYRDEYEQLDIVFNLDVMG